MLFVLVGVYNVDFGSSRCVAGTVALHIRIHLERFQSDNNRLPCPAETRTWLRSSCNVPCMDKHLSVMDDTMVEAGDYNMSLSS